MFFQKLEALRAEFPMCYLEAWCPDDFELKWNSPKAVDVADHLFRRFDANEGTNWMRIKDAKECVAEESES